MSTTPVVAKTNFDWKSLIPVFELAGNLSAEILIPGGVALAPLLVSLEQSLNPLLMSIGTKPSVSTEIMAVYATAIGILNILKQKSGLDPAILAKVNEYLSAAQDATSAYLLAAKGFDASLFTPVAPIA